MEGRGGTEHTQSHTGEKKMGDYFITYVFREICIFLLAQVVTVTDVGLEFFGPNWRNNSWADQEENVTQRRLAK